MKTTMQLTGMTCEVGKGLFARARRHEERGPGNDSGTCVCFVVHHVLRLAMALSDWAMCMCILRGYGRAQDDDDGLERVIGMSIAHLSVMDLCCKRSVVMTERCRSTLCDQLGAQDS